MIRSTEILGLLIAVSVIADTPYQAQQLPGKPLSIQNGGKSYSIRRPAVGEYRFEVRSNDQWEPDSHSVDGKERSEIAFPQRFALGQTFKASFDLKADVGKASEKGWLIVGQFHTTPAPGVKASPPVRQVFQNGQFSIVVQYQKPNEQSVQQKIFTTDNFRAKAWHHLEYVIRFGLENGQVTARLDGKQVADYHGPLGYPNENGAYFKAGIYRPRNPERAVVWFKNIEVYSKGNE